MILTWLGALAIGLALGLLGSGGSILTVPVLVYLAGQDEKSAIAGSLLIVGAVAAIGGLRFAWKKNVDWSSVLYFGVPGMAGTYWGAWLGGQVSGTVQLVTFALVLLVAAAMMARPLHLPDHPVKGRRSVIKIGFEGLMVGLLTGFVGVGGGFLIVPALVMLGGLPMHLAIGTSLVIIALKSSTGFFKYLSVLTDLGQTLDWSILGLITLVAVAGTFAGQKLGGQLSPTLLRRVFAGSLLMIASAILWQALPEFWPATELSGTEPQAIPLDRVAQTPTR